MRLRLPGLTLVSSAPALTDEMAVMKSPAIPAMLSTKKIWRMAGSRCAADFVVSELKKLLAVS